jgi:hypothetical protein
VAAWIIYYLFYLSEKSQNSTTTKAREKNKQKCAIVRILEKNMCD